MMRRGAAVSAAVFALVVLAATPAAAHAQLTTTDPLAAAVLDEPPEEITLSFTEPVETSLGGVRLYDGSAERVDLGSPQHAGGDRSQVRVEVGDLEDGSYVVTWRVTSADSHPIQGAFTFQVGPDATANVGSLAEQLLAEQGGDRLVGVVYGVDRFLVFASIAVLLGGLGFAVLVAPSTRSHPTVRRILWSALVVCVATTAAAVALQGAHASGLGLIDSLRPSVVADVLDTQFGRVSVARVVLLVVLALLMRRLLARGPRAEAPVPMWWPAVTTLTVVAIAATPGLGGHATSGDHTVLAVVTDTLHVLAMSLWIGGLVLLVAVFLPGRDAARAEGGVTRFSRLALGCVATLVATGAFQSWRQVGSLEALRDTDYGQLLVLKVVLVAAMIVVAAFSREVVFRLYHRERLEAAVAQPLPSGGALDLDDRAAGQPAEPPAEERVELRRLRRSVGVEVVFAVAVLAVTAMLVNTPPGRAEVEGPFATIVQTEEDLRFDVLVAPATAGPNDIHLTAQTRGGGPTDPLEVTATAAHPDPDIAPIEIPLRQLGPGHYLASGFNMPGAGEWRLEITTLLTEVNELTTEVPVTLR